MPPIDDGTLAKLRQIVAKYAPGVALDDDTPLISGGLVDSMAIIDMLLDIEAVFSISIPASEVQPDDFDSVRKIGEILARYR